ncbi:hypothetical protein ACFL6G_00190 [candidate division KSB1 bacterium]
MNTTIFLTIFGITLLCSIGFFTAAALSQKVLKREKIRVKEYDWQDELELLKFKRWKDF